MDKALRILGIVALVEAIVLMTLTLVLGVVLAAGLSSIGDEPALPDPAPVPSESVPPGQDY